MSEETLSVRSVRLLVDAVDQRAVSRACFLAAARLDPEQLDAVEGRVPSAKYYRLCELALDMTGDPALGLHTLKFVRPDSVDLVGHLVAHASTVRKALDSLLRLHKLVGDRCRFRLIETDRHVTLRYECPDGLSERARRFVAEMQMTGIYRLFRYFARNARPLEVSFEHDPPAYRSEYTRIFKGAERFGRPFTAIVFDRRWLDAPRRYRDEELHGTLYELAQNRVARLGRQPSCVDEMREVIASSPGPGKLGMAAVARALGVSTRTLRRRLTAEGTSFEAVVNDALATRARRLLIVEKRTIQETAYHLGYSDRCAFHRAFKRWTGTTPSTWQAENKLS
jgi:AraC-like DNA-binding protein